MKRTEKLLQTFYHISGMRVALYDKHLHCVAWAGPTAYSYCNAVHTSAEGFNRCFASDEAAFRAVAKSGKTHTFTCPFGLFEAVAPVKTNGQLSGYLFIGEAIVKDAAGRERALREGLCFAGESCDRQKLGRLIDALATHTEEALGGFAKTLELFADQLGKSEVLSEKSPALADTVRDYLDRHFATRITLLELALHFHCSTVTLTEHFRRAFGTSIMRYVCDLRLAAAADLLRTTDLPVGEVASACGFENPEHFSKMFKRAKCLSPAHWRKAYQNHA
ncbi:MAG: helix-turn-helix domain-containing protein [Clostridia bacterium]|nr:helix-turn-helix domain-containing protein [Clostridia bacterium]